MKKILLLVLFVVICSFTVLAEKEVPDFTIALGDDAPASDVMLASQVIQELKSAGYEDFPVGVTKLFSEVNGIGLDQKVTLAIYNNKAVIIVGATSPSSHVMFATEITQILTYKNVESNTILSSDVESSDLNDLFETEEPEPEGCTDTDDGIDYFEKGTATTSETSYTDWCQIGGDYPEVSECSGNDCELVEAYCDEDEEDHIMFKKYICPDGCKNGACIKGTTKELPPFTIGLGDDAPALDTVLASDVIQQLKQAGYKDIPVGVTRLFSEISALMLDKRVTLAIYENEAVIIIGETSPSSHTIFGTEIKQILIRKGVDSKVILSSEVESADLIDLFNCELVATLKEGSSKTYTVGNKNYNVKALGDDGGPTKYNVNGESLEFISGEYIKLSDGTIFTELPISKGPDMSTFCFLKEDKAPTCKDTDKGKNYYLKGTVTIGPYRKHADYCSNENELMENSCKNELELETETYLCLNGCKDGACIPSEDKIVLTEDETESSTECPKKSCTIKSEECSGSDKIVLEECKVYIEKNGQCEEIITTNSKTETGGCFDKTTDVFQCQGCQLDKDKCIPFGTRLERNSIGYYCDISNKLSEQKENKETCQNSYDCLSNNCKSGTCTPICEGCLDENNVCIPIGTRTEAQYCDIDYAFENQKSEDMSCNNNYECSTNMCVNNKCISPSFIQKIIDWFSKLFGG